MKYLFFPTGNLLPKYLDMARPKIVQEQKRIYRYVIRLNEKEQQKFMAAAEVSGVEVYKLLRAKLLTGRFPEAKIARIDLGVYLELKKIGVNVNQIAKQVNAGKLPFEIRKILLQLQEQQHLIIKVLLHDRDSENR
ncbi:MULTISPECIES: plasmid mobilization relaxosome protein MobC [unclassified Mucilaginibacter]|uniref:plasmid mobilization relaxosome protein MobC n=2 Tax=unclassified Mucilaginibacter TaxID=2617802 RepID=UPI002B2362DF|nr:MULTISPECIES: plasmid mobilization relaxosome protein MobC [unclassified Mucilaginibacter]MEB0300892.1 plasmid mobilization relaxosome protein MobC [Mucilaginibacter sp. 5C4]